MKMYSTYNKVRDVFVAPQLRWSFCRWTKSPLLPVWRHGNAIRFARRFDEYDAEWCWARMISCTWTEVGKKNHPILSKIVKPLYYLPIWCSFYFRGHDVFYKTKYDEYRFEFPPQMSIVFFGWSLNFWLVNPTGDTLYDGDYWESILTYLDNGDLEKTRKELGVWTKESGEQYWVLRDEFLKESINF